jgi:hypothetical protein
LVGEMRKAAPDISADGAKINRRPLGVKVKRSPAAPAMEPAKRCPPVGGKSFEQRVPARKDVCKAKGRDLPEPDTSNRESDTEHR